MMYLKNIVAGGQFDCKKFPFKQWDCGFKPLFTVIRISDYYLPGCWLSLLNS